jgi:septal ring factor EnvC (AmiA/AmiB activator)
MHLNTVMCGLLILFFSWMLAHHAFVPHSKSKSNSDTWVEGFVPKQAEAAAEAAEAAATESEVSELKKQLATLAQTAQQLRTQMISNEAGIQKNTANLQEIIKSQNDANAKMAEMKNNAK